MKPGLGRKVYCLYCDGILVDEVGYLGKESFILSTFGYGVEEDSLEWRFEDYNVQWFTNLYKAKNALLKKFQKEGNTEMKVVKKSDIWYELEEIKEGE